METININSENFEDIENSEEVGKLENYLAGVMNVDDLVCGFLRFTGQDNYGRDSQIYYYKAERSGGCISVVFSRNGRVTSISGNTFLATGDEFTVTVKNDENFGIQCC